MEAIVESDWTNYYLAPGVSYANGAVTFAPAAASAPSETHSALLLSQTRMRNFFVDLEFTTTAQLRTGSDPNPWETFWLMYNYIPQVYPNKTTNCLVFKPTQLQISTADHELGEIFLVDYTPIKCAIGSTYRVQVMKIGRRLMVSVGVDSLSRFVHYETDRIAHYDQSGYFGLYCEDASVTVTGFEAVAIG